MSFDLEGTLKAMGNAARESVKDDVGDMGDFGKTVVENNRDALERLATARIDGVIDQEELERELERKKLVLEAEMLTLQIMTKAAAQKAINAAFDVFRSAVKSAIGLA